MKDKFEIFKEIIEVEYETNHAHIYISIGQIVRIMWLVDTIYDAWDNSLTAKENVLNHFERNIKPLGQAGMNRL